MFALCPPPFPLTFPPGKIPSPSPLFLLLSPSGQLPTLPSCVLSNFLSRLRFHSSFSFFSEIPKSHVFFCPASPDASPQLDSIHPLIPPPRSSLHTLLPHFFLSVPQQGNDFFPPYVNLQRNLPTAFPSPSPPSTIRPLCCQNVLANSRHLISNFAFSLPSMSFFPKRRPLHVTNSPEYQELPYNVRYLEPFLVSYLPFSPEAILPPLWMRFPLHSIGPIHPFPGCCLHIRRVPCGPADCAPCLMSSRSNPLKPHPSPIDCSHLFPFLPYPAFL